MAEIDFAGEALRLRDSLISAENPRHEIESALRSIAQRAHDQGRDEGLARAGLDSREFESEIRADERVKVAKETMAEIASARSDERLQSMRCVDCGQAFEVEQALVWRTMTPGIAHQRCQPVSMLADRDQANWHTAEQIIRADQDEQTRRKWAERMEAEASIQRPPDGYTVRYWAKRLRENQE